MRTFVPLVFVAALLVGCGESPSSSAGGGGSGAGGSTSTAGSGGGGAGGASIPLVINEISATGDEFIELVNTASEPFAIAGYAVADTDPLTGGPKASEAARFPAGAEIAPGEHLMILCGQLAADGVGPHDVCGTAGPASCYYATWNVSAKDGEKLYLLSPADETLLEAQYPVNAVAVGHTWGRFPDTTGSFTETAPTPGKANAPP